MIGILKLLEGLTSIFNKVLDIFREKRLVNQGRSEQKAEDNAKVLESVKTAFDAAYDPAVVAVVRHRFKRD